MLENNKSLMLENNKSLSLENNEEIMMNKNKYLVLDSIAYFLFLFQHAGGRDVSSRHEWTAHDRHQGAGKTRGGHRFANNKQDGVHGLAFLPVCV